MTKNKRNFPASNPFVLQAHHTEHFFHLGGVMKYARFAFVALLAVSFAAAGTPAGSEKSVDWNKAEQNYVAGLKSDNPGLQSSAASHIRKYNLTGTVEELKSLLCKNCADNVKMSVAMTLVRIGGDEGRDAVKKALKTEENELIAEFYRTLLQAPETAHQ